MQIIGNSGQNIDLYILKQMWICQGEIILKFKQYENANIPNLCISKIPSGFLDFEFCPQKQENKEREWKCSEYLDLNPTREFCWHSAHSSLSTKGRF